MGIDCLRFADVVEEETPVDEDDEEDDDDDVRCCDELLACFSLSVTRSRLLSKDSGDDEFERSLLHIETNDGFVFVSNGDAEEACGAEAFVAANKRALVESRFGRIDGVVDGAHIEKN